MTPTAFDKFMTYVIDKHILEVMCSKSKEYARDGDKLYNFYRAGVMSGKAAIECLRGMKLKHDVSLDDMLNDLNDPNCPPHSQDKWQEKLSDDINYLFLLWALLTEKYCWDIPPRVVLEPANWDKDL